MSDLLPASLALAVPIRIALYRARGGPTEADWVRTLDFAPDLAARGECLTARVVAGDTADMFNRLADALAVLAFRAEGGVKAFGLHFEAAAQRRKKPRKGK